LSGKGPVSVLKRNFWREQTGMGIFQREWVGILL
jgi:hypothetical protein